MLETKDQGHKCKCFPKKKGLKNFFSVHLQKKKKNGIEKDFSANLQNFNHSKNSAVLEPRTGQFSRTGGIEAKAKDFKMCPRMSSRPRTSSRTPPLLIDFHSWSELLGSLMADRKLVQKSKSRVQLQSMMAN